MMGGKDSGRWGYIITCPFMPRCAVERDSELSSFSGNTQHFAHFAIIACSMTVKSLHKERQQGPYSC
jgi:hypothetical protein